MTFVPKIGLEIEVPLKYYFPDIHKKYFGDGKKWSTLSDIERMNFSDELSNTGENKLLDKLDDTCKRLGLKRGRDRYWEFIFPPVEKAYSHAPAIEYLAREQLLPYYGMPLSTHFTISNITRDEAFAILFHLEMTYLHRGRLMEAIGKGERLTWNRKGNAGMVKKGKMDLLYDEYAFELRTLKISPYDCEAALLAIDNMLKRRTEIVQSAKDAIKNMGLEWKLWDDADFEVFATHLPN